MNHLTRILLAAALLAAVHNPAAALGMQAVDDYWPVASGRAGRIAEGLGIADEALRGRLVEAVAGQYRDLFILHALRDEALQAVADDHGFTLFSEAARAGIETGTRQAIEQLHREFVARLSALVDPAAVEAVKDGMTYGVAPNTLKVYRDMFPDLPDEQAEQIKAWLWEAREHAMDAGSSDDKHKWFGKYKGRINNYLSSLGHDLKAAERDMWERKKQEQQKHDD